MGRILIINCGQFNVSTDNRIQNHSASTNDQSPANIAGPIVERLKEYVPYTIYACSVPGTAEMVDIITGKEKKAVNWLKIDSTDSDLDRLRGKLATEIDRLLNLHKEETFVLVSTGILSVLTVLHLLHLNNSHIGQITQDAGAINLFETRSGVPSALFINDVCHLHI